MSEIKNTGLNLAKEKAEQDGTEHKVGYTSPEGIYNVPLTERDNYLPWGELQRGREDFMDCASRDPHNTLELFFNYAYRNNLMKPENKVWLFNKGYIVFHDGLPYVEFSDRFTAILSGTTKDGNSMKAPRQSIHSNGLIPKQMLPANSKMRFADYHNRKDITKEMMDLGKEFLTRFAINYEQYRISDLESMLRKYPVGLAGFAWGFPNKDGIYERRAGSPLNHAFMGFGLPVVRIFDNYIDSHDGDWIKQLAPDYEFYEYGYRTFIREERTPAEYRSLLQKAVDLIKEIIQGMMPPKSYDQDPRTLPMNQPIEETKPVTPPHELYLVAKEWLGKDASPKNLAPSDLACAETISHLISLVTPWPAITGTWTLNAQLNLSPKFTSIGIEELQAGDILMYETGQFKTDKVGHVFICGENGVLYSNNSKTGKLDTFYTITSARKEWEGVGYKPRCYRLISK